VFRKPDVDWRLDLERRHHLDNHDDRRIGSLKLPDWLPAESQVARHFSQTARYPHYKLTVAKYLSALLPDSGDCQLLDVGTGDGKLASFLQAHRPATRVVGVEILRRPDTVSSVPVALFDGKSLPFADKTFDVSLICDVLHHTKDQPALISEVLRVTRKRILIKDHLYKNRIQKYLLLVLDLLGNYRFGIKVTGDYLSPEDWIRILSSAAIETLSLYHDVPVRKPPLRFLFTNAVEIIFVLDLKHYSRPT
jgi:SAM-dependent methyltransferase